MLLRRGFDTSPIGAGLASLCPACSPPEGKKKVKKKFDFDELLGEIGIIEKLCWKVRDQKVAFFASLGYYSKFLALYDIVFEVPVVELYFHEKHVKKKAKQSIISAISLEYAVGAAAIEKLTQKKNVYREGNVFNTKYPAMIGDDQGLFTSFFCSSQSTQLCEISDAINSIGLVTCGTDSDINVPLSDYGDTEVNNGY